MNKVFLLVAMLLFPSLLHARPVSYPDGWTLMTRNNWEKHRAHLHYSPTKNYSVGVVYEHFREDDEDEISLQLNRLLLRKNRKGSQRNLYLKSQAGASGWGGKLEPSGQIGFSGDWESRKYYSSYSIAGRYEGFSDQTSMHQMMRLGVAPYVGDYGSLHTWIMLQAEHHPHEEDESREFILSPMLRMFKSEYLMEIGYSFERDFMFNFVVRY